MRHRVLVVDDYEIGARLFATFVESLGHEVDLAHDGETALALARAKGTFTVAILDIEMPGMDGFTLASKLREHFGQTITLMALTAYSSERYRARAAEVGFDFFFVKPADLDEIETTLARIHVASKPTPGE